MVAATRWVPRHNDWVLTNCHLYPGVHEMAKVLQVLPHTNDPADVTVVYIVPRRGGWQTCQPESLLPLF